MAQYQLIWSEEFDQDGLPNSEIWSNEEGLVRNNELQYYTVNRPENCRVEDGHLILEAHKESFEKMNYTSASIVTKGNKSFLYGRIEVRAKLPTGRGVWPAIWTLGTNIDQVGWPLCGEIDIMENVGYDPLNVHGNIHTKAYNHNLGTNKGNFIEVADPNQQFHIYAIDWTESKIDFWIDDQKYFTFSKEKDASTAEWPFDQPQYLLLNLAIGGFWGGKEGIDEAIFPQQYLVDYVRYYQLKDE